WPTASDHPSAGASRRSTPGSSSEGFTHPFKREATLAPVTRGANRSVPGLDDQKGEQPRDADDGEGERDQAARRDRWPPGLCAQRLVQLAHADGLTLRRQESEPAALEQLGKRRDGALTPEVR